MATIAIKRGTRAQVDAAAALSALQAGEPYLMTDEERIAVGLGLDTYITLPKMSDIGGGGGTAFASLQVDLLLTTLDPVTMNDPIPNSVGRTFNGEETITGLMGAYGSTFGNVYTLDPAGGSWVLTTELADGTLTAFVVISGPTADYGPEDRQVIGIKRDAATRSLAFRVPGVPLIRTSSADNGYSRLGDAMGDMSGVPTAAKHVAGSINELAAATKQVGEVTMFAGSSAPLKHKLCDGSAISRTTYAALFTVIGTTYGAGNGTTTFTLPNLGGKVPLGVDGSHALGVAAGASSVTLTRSQMPAYPIDSRGVGAITATGGAQIFLSATPGGGPSGAQIFATAEPAGANIGGYLMGGSTQSAVNITPAHLAMNFVIYTGV